MKQNWSEEALDRLYQGSAHEAAPSAIDAPVLAAASSRARRTRWTRRGILLLPLAAVAFSLWPTTPGRHPGGQIEAPATTSLRDELARTGTLKPATTSVVAAYLLNASPYASVEPEHTGVIAPDGKRP